MRATVVVIATGAWLAASPAMVEAAPEQQAILTLTVNEVGQGDITVTLRGSDVLVTASDLETAGVKLTGGEHGAADPNALVSLASLAPDLQFVVDLDQLTLKVTAAPRLLGEVVFDLRTERPTNVVDTKTSSAWLNYAVSTGTGGEATVAGEAGASLGGSLLVTNVTRQASGDVRRNNSSWTIDWPAQLMRAVLGDGYADAGGLGGGAFIGGIGIARAYELDPYAVRHPTFGLAGATASPSELDVYVNGALVRREQLAPGAFQIKNLPLANGSGDTRLVIKDSFGREQVVDQRYYFSTGLLGKGLTDFAFHVGARRLDIGNANWHYGGPVMVSRYRQGVTNSLTAGAHAEAAWDLISGGANVATALPFGEFELEAAASRAGSSHGGAALARYVFASPRGNIGFSGQLITNRFATLSRNATDDRSTVVVQALAGTHVGRVGLTLQIAQEHQRDANVWTQRAQLGITSPIGSRLSASITATASASPMTGNTGELFALLSAPLGERTSATVALNHASNDQATLGVQRSLPIGTGVGYQVQASTGMGMPSDVDGTLKLQERYGRYEIHGDENASGHTWSVSAAGGLVAIGGNVFATRPIQDAFALVRVPGVAGVHATINNVDVGKTDRNGDLLIPTLLPYFGNRIAIRDSDVPINRSLETTKIDATAPYRGGTVVLFPARELHSIAGALVVIEADGSRSAPRFGTLTVMAHDGPLSSPIGYDGEFFIEQIVTGRYAATIEYAGGTCRFQLAVPAGDAPIAALGVVPCTASKGSP